MKQHIFLSLHHQFLLKPERDDAYFYTGPAWVRSSLDYWKRYSTILEESPYDIFKNGINLSAFAVQGQWAKRPFCPLND